MYDLPDLVGQSLIEIDRLLIADRGGRRGRRGGHIMISMIINIMISSIIMWISMIKKITVAKLFFM